MVIAARGPVVATIPSCGRPGWVLSYVGALLLRRIQRSGSQVSMQQQGENLISRVTSLEASRGEAGHTHPCSGLMSNRLPRAGPGRGSITKAAKEDGCVQPASRFALWAE